MLLHEICLSLEILLLWFCSSYINKASNVWKGFQLYLKFPQRTVTATPLELLLSYALSFRLRDLVPKKNLLHSERLLKKITKMTSIYK